VTDTQTHDGGIYRASIASRGKNSAVREKFSYRRQFTLLIIAPFAAIRQNRHIMQNISEYLGPILTFFTGLVGVLVGMIIQVFVWRSPKGRCYGNQLNLGDVRKECGANLLFATAFDNGLADRKSAFKRFNGNNQATWCPYLVNCVQ